MLSAFLATDNIVFTGALVLMIALGAVQAIGLGDFGPDIDADLDLDGDTGGDGIGAANGFLSLIGIGRVPLVIWLAVFLALFGVIGLAGQQFIATLTGSGLTPLLAAPLAALASLPLTGALVRPLARILPGDETSAVNTTSLIGRFATIEIGRAETGSPARAKCVDRFGQPHFVMVEPDNAGQIFQTGEEILLVRHEGNLFKAITRGNRHLPQLDV